MGDRHEHSPSRDNRDEDQREFYRAMVVGQERIAQALQTLTTRVERMNSHDRQNQEQEHDNRSVAGSQGAPRHRSWTADRPTRPTFLREVTQEVEEDDMPEDFQDDLLAADAEWQALPHHVREMLNFDRYLSQRREHMRSSRQNRRPRGGQESELQ